MQQETHELVVCPASEVAPGNSEGSVLRLRDGRLLLAYTYFYGAEAKVTSPARISAKLSEDEGRTWGKRFPLHEKDEGINVTTPSLIRLRSGEIALFFLHKTHRDECVPSLKKSQDDGKSWEKPKQVTKEDQIYDMANASVIQLSTGRILIPFCRQDRRQRSYSASCLYSDDNCRSWRRSETEIDLPKEGAMDPHLVELENGKILMTIRNQLGRVYQASSNDQGVTWTNVDSTDLLAPDSPTIIRRIPRTGDLPIIWNNNREKRRPLTSAISTNEGEDWRNLKDIETGEEYTYSHPSVTFIDENVLLIYNLYDQKTGWVSLKQKKLSMEWLYS